MSSKPVVAVEGVRKLFRIHATPAQRIANFISLGTRCPPRTHWALDGVSFEVNRGETLGLLGNNGSGKSTLLQMVAGTMTPTEGRIAVRGRTSALLELGAGFNPDFTGRENVRLGLGLAGVEETEIERIMPWVEAFAEIGELIDRPVRSFSSGMFVRLAFAAAVCVRPDVLVIDEALAVGDVGFQQKCFRYIREELKHVAKLFVSHDLQSIAALCDRVVVIERGRIAYDGSVAGGLRVYLSRKQRPDVERARGQEPCAAPLRAFSTEAAINGARGHIVKAGDEVSVKMHAESEGRVSATISLVWQDRYERTVHRCAPTDIEIRAGQNEGMMTFSWPRVHPGEYLLGVDVSDRRGARLCRLRGADILSCVDTGALPGIVEVQVRATGFSEPEVVRKAG